MERRIADGSIHVVSYTTTAGGARVPHRRSPSPPGVIDVEGEVVEEDEPKRPPRLVDVET